MALRVRKPEAIPSLVGQSLEARDGLDPGSESGVTNYTNALSYK